jgi:FSR family fosmidomycin resistance protein-like MFS transporter
MRYNTPSRRITGESLCKGRSMPHATRSLFLTALGHLTIELSSNYLPVLYPLLIAALRLSYSQVGSIALVAGVSTSLTQPLFGWVSDRWHPHVIIVASVFWNGLLMALVGFSASYFSLILLVALGALGSAAFHPSGATLASAGGGSRRGAAVSVFSVGGNLGAALSPLWITLGLGWLGVRGTALLIPVALGMGLFLLRHMPSLAHNDERHVTREQQSPAEWSRRVLVLIVMAMAFRAWFQVSLTTYLPTWAETQGHSLAAGGRMLFVLLACVGVGSLLGGALSDRIGRWQVLVLSLTLLGPVEWAFLTIPLTLQPALLAGVGILLGATFPVSIVLAQEAWPGAKGIASGLVIGLPWVGGGIGASLTGFIADHYSLTTGLQWLILPAVLAAASMLLLAAFQLRSSPGIT